LRPDDHRAFIYLANSLRIQALSDAFKNMKQGSRAKWAPKNCGNVRTAAHFTAEDFLQALKMSESVDDSSTGREMDANKALAKIVKLLEIKFDPRMRQLVEIMYEGYVKTKNGYTQDEIGKRLGRSRDTAYRLQKELREFLNEVYEDEPF
jgi:hypothetical protein